MKIRVISKNVEDYIVDEHTGKGLIKLAMSDDINDIQKFAEWRRDNHQGCNTTLTVKRLKK